ncbi:MAG TPA: hypothetical protein VG265_10620 [Gaiellaceae bacterium]|nr:hypothetical protein [Gaiellaceae bacterium]
MQRRRIGRFLVEALFLAGAAAAVTVANLQPVAVIALMALAWVVVALLEWISWLDEPHYGRGLPPRYYVPQVALPPPRAVEQPGPYPTILEPDDEPTFVASVTEWAADLEQWPVLDTSAEEETQIALPEADRAYGYGIEHGDEAEPDAEFPPELSDVLPPLPASLHEADFPDDEDEPTGEDAEDAHRPAILGDAPTEDPVIPAPIEMPAAPARRPIPATEPERLASRERIQATAVHHIDPLADGARRRLFRRSVEEAVVEVPDGPPADRVLPGQAR